MHELAPLIKDLAVILGLAGLVSLLFQKIRQPVVLGYLLAGAVVGPFTPPHALVEDIPNIQILSELGVIFLMFSLGLEFSFHKLKRVGFSASITGFIEVIFMLAIGLIVGRLIGWSFFDSLFLGAALAISSTTIIIKALEELNLKGKRFAEIIFGVLIIEDLLAILLLVALSTIVATNNFFSSAILFAGLKLLLVVGGWFLIGYFIVPSLFRKIESYVSEEILTIVSVALCLLLVCIAAYFHYSTALGAFIMGSILAETPLVQRIEHLVQPIRNIFAAVFFVSIGMLIDPKLIWDQLPLVGLICLVTIFGKLIVTGTGAFLTGQSLNSSLRIGFSMAQIGEFSFIIAGLGMALGATSNTLYPIIVAVSAITTFTTPYLIQLSGHLSEGLDQRLSPRAKYFLDSYASWIYRVLASSEEQALYRNGMLRLLVNGLVVAIVFNVTQYGLLPKIAAFIPYVWSSKIVGWLVAMVLSSPFIWGMLTALRKAAGTSDKIERHLSAPRLYVSWLLTLLELTGLSIAFFETWAIALILLLVIGVFYKLLYKKLDKSYRWFEAQLVRNLQGKIVPSTPYQQLAPWDNQFFERQVNYQSALVNKTLAELRLRQQYGINVVAIYRESFLILSPRGQEIILPFDRLVLLGNDEQIELFTQQFIQTDSKSETANLLEHFALKAILLGDEHPLIDKTVHSSGIREKAKGLIVGIERDSRRFLNPDSTMQLVKGDLLFVVGEAESLKNMD